MNPYKIDREGKDWKSNGELCCLCLAFFTPSPTLHCPGFSCAQPLLPFPCLHSSPPLLLSSSLRCSIPPSSSSTPHIALALCFTPCYPACSQPCCSPTHIAFSRGFFPLHMLPSILCAPPSIHEHTQGQICTNLGILALVSLPVKLLFLHIRPRQECRDIYETLFNVLKSHRLEHLGN